MTLERTRGFVFVVAIACWGLPTPLQLIADDVVGPLRKQISFPLQGARVQGVRIKLEVGDQTMVGYLPVKITLQGVPRFTADRRFVIQFRGESEYESPPQNGLIVNVPVTAPQGARSEVVIRYLPKWSAGQAMSISVSEEGRELEGYSTFFGGDNRTSQLYTRIRGRVSGRRFLGVEHQINWAYISHLDQVSADSMPDLWNAFSGASAYELDRRGAVRLFTDFGSRDWASVIDGSTFHAIGQGSLPEDWRAYQRYDMILLDPQALERLGSHAKALAAVRDWVLNGGTIAVYNAKSEQGVAELLDVAWTNGASANDYLDAVAREARYVAQQSQGNLLNHVSNLRAALKVARSVTDPNAAQQVDLEQQMELVGIDDSIRFQADTYLMPMEPPDDPNAPQLPDTVTLQEKQMAYVDELEGELRAQEQTLEQIDSELSLPFGEWMERVQVRLVGAGQLVVIKADPQHAMPSRVDWQLAAKMLDHRASPTLRRGVDPLLGDRRFSRWAIPGVAQPPVYTFMGLLTVFVVLVGPIAYRRTSKIGRSYLMFAIAPALALVTTSAMFGYGIVSDGFGTMARVRQLTWVDGKSGDAGERVRSTYFAGIRPSDGIRFAGDAEVMIYPEGTGLSWADRESLPPATLGQVVVDEESQRLGSTFLPSREQRQFVVHAPRRGVGSLTLKPDPNGIAPPNVQSDFDFPIHQAVLRDDKGVYWQIDNLAAGATQTSEPLSVRDASKLMGQLYTDHRPLSSVREASPSGRRYNNQIYDVIVDTNRVLQTRVAVNDGGFEFWLQQHLQTMGEIPNLFFVGIADVSRDVLAVEKCELRSSVRYVFGTLR